MKSFFLKCALAAVLLGTASCSEKADTAMADKVAAEAKAAADMVKAKEAQETGIDAYVYAYPLVTMD